MIRERFQRRRWMSEPKVRHTRESPPLNDGEGVDAALAVGSVRRDFGQLLALFESHLAALDEWDDPRRRHIAAARMAAARGYRLSSDLLDRMRAQR